MSSSSQAPESWISAFCSLVGHEYFAEVSEDFIEDDFNLTGLQSQVPMYKEALEMILDVEPEDVSDEEEEEEEEDDEDDEEMQDGIDVGRGYRRDAAAEQRRHYRMPSDQSVIESSAEMLYGLIHQRFITSRPGIQQMAEKYELNHFGHCPRVFCHGAKVLPVGCSDLPGQETVKLFCPSCLDVYSPPNSRFQTVDGAFFGTTFGCLFFMTFPDLDVGGQQRPIPAVPTSSQSANASTTSSPVASPLDRTTSSGPSSRAPPNGSSTAATTTAATAPTAASESNIPSLRTPDQINGINPRNLAPGLGANSIYEPRIYGFRVSEMAKTGPRMKWLRARPEDVEELDETYMWHTVQQQEENAGALNGEEVGEEGEEMDEGDEDNEGVNDGGGDVVMAGEGEVGPARRRLARREAQQTGRMETEPSGNATRRKVKEKFGLGDSARQAGGALVNGETGLGRGGAVAVRIGDEG